MVQDRHGAMQSPRVVEGQKSRGGIATAAAEPRRNRDMLLQRDGYPLTDVFGLLKGPRRAHDQVPLIGRERRWAAGQGNGPQVIGTKAQPITEVKHQQDSLDGMIPIGPFAEDTQAQVDFGRGGEPARRDLHGRDSPDYSNGVTRTPSGGKS